MKLLSTSMDSVPSANDEAASSSNVDIIVNSDQDAIMEKEAAAEGTYMDPQLYDAAVNGNIEPFDTVRELDSIVTPKKNTILHINIMSRSISSMETASTKFVEDILDKCPSLLRQVNINDETPLHIAAKYGHSDIVDILIKSSAKHEDLESGTIFIGMTNNEGDTALHEVVRYEHLDVVKILTRKDPDFSYSSNKRGETPLYIAAAKDSLEIVVEILETCTLPAYEGPDQMTALHAAAMNHGKDITREILKKKKSLIKERDQYGWTPLHYAAYHRNRKSMEALLECDISAAYIGDKHRKMTPLHIAIGRGYIPHVLLSRCPNCCELVDERRWNALHFAVLSLSTKDLKILLKKYPLIRDLINDKDVDGNTPLHFLATFRSHLLWTIKHDVKDVKLDLDVVNNQNMRVWEVLKSDSDQLKQEILKLEEAAGPYGDGVVCVNKPDDSDSDDGDSDDGDSDEGDSDDGDSDEGDSDDGDDLLRLLRSQKRKKEMEKVKERSHKKEMEKVKELRRKKEMKRVKELSEKRKEEMEKVKDSHLIVAALIATVTFTAAFTLPGGVIQDGDKEGTAILSKKAAFQAFVITDAIAMVLSLSAVFAHFLMSLHRGENTSKKITILAMYGALSTLIAMVAMVIAFVTGTYAVLTTSLWLAILTTCIGLSFVILMFLICMV